MAELYDKDGNLVEGAITKEELDTKLGEAKISWEAEQKPAEEQKQVEQKQTDEVPPWAKKFVDGFNTLQEQVNNLNGNQTTTHISRFKNAVDTARQADFQTKFDSLTGYENTPEGLEKRAADAYLLTTGQRYEESGMDMRGFTSNGRGPVDTIKPTNSESIKAIDQTFGISEADAEKYGNK